MLPLLQEHALLVFLGHCLFLPSTNFNFCTMIIFGFVVLLFCYLYLRSGDIEVSPGSSQKNWGTSEGYKLLSGRSW